LLLLNEKREHVDAGECMGLDLKCGSHGDTSIDPSQESESAKTGQGLGLGVIGVV
jgi:hypothetical protein